MTWKPGVYDSDDEQDNEEDASDASGRHGATGSLPGVGRPVRRFRVSVGGIPYLVEVEELPERQVLRTLMRSAASGPGPSFSEPSLRPLPGAISGRPPWPGWGNRP
ncbi:MAG: hypothetical protein AB1609_08505 [Bacillota bacterium]